MASAKNLSEFKYACRAYLPKLNAADLAKARAYFTESKWKKEDQATADDDATDQGLGS